MQRMQGPGMTIHPRYAPPPKQAAVHAQPGMEELEGRSAAPSNETATNRSNQRLWCPHPEAAPQAARWS
jgi:hypothetical protein